MSQLNTSIIFYSQAVKQLQDLKDKYSYGITSVDTFMEELHGVLTRFEDSVGTPLTKYDPVVETEPPLSHKYNLFIDGIQSDVNILQYQLDVLRSAAIGAHNIITTEILKSKAENIRVSNKAKTLQLYSNSVDSSIITFGDYFQDDEFLDNGIVPVLEQTAIPSPGYLILGQVGAVHNLSPTASIKILDTSNGFSGNLHEITKTTNNQLGNTDQQSTQNNPDSQFVFLQQPIFKAETNPSSFLQDILDGEPNTWFEYENCLISDSDRLKGKNLGFSYERINPITNQVEQIDWAKGPDGNILKLGLEFDLQAVNTINYITFMPYNLDDNANYALHITQVQTSNNGTDWDVVKPSEIFVGTTPNIKTAIGSDKIYSSAGWSFAGRSVRFVRIFIEQQNPIMRDIGHIYYLDADGKRVAGPIPPATNPTTYYNPQAYTSEGLIQKREVFQAKRWVIGVRDVTISQSQYAETSYAVTKLLRVNGIIDRVALDADIEIPADFPDDEPWVSFFVSPNNGSDWFQISRIQDDFQDIPEIVAFNDPAPVEFRESGVGYLDVDGSVKNLRLKIVLKRPSDMSSATPIVKSFKLKVKLR